MKKHILCLGDSNTHGYCADPNDCSDHGIRFNEDERWTCVCKRRWARSIWSPRKVFPAAPPCSWTRCMSPWTH